MDFNLKKKKKHPPLPISHQKVGYSAPCGVGSGEISLTLSCRLSRFRILAVSSPRVPLQRLKALLGQPEVFQELGAGGIGKGPLLSPAPLSILFLFSPGPAPPLGHPPQA